jgi:hypothetical protein
VYLYDLKKASVSKSSIGYHVFIGLMYSIKKKFSLELEIKLNVAKGKLTGFFKDFGSFDISAYQVSFGFNKWL